MVSMRAHITIDSVSCSSEWTVNTGLDKQFFKDDTVDRDEIRELLQKTFSQIHRTDVGVYFEDECRTCGELLPSEGGPENVDGCFERWHGG